MENKVLRIGYFADGIWAHEALKRLLKMNNVKVAFICVRFDSKDPVLLKMGAEHNIDVLFHSNINSDDFYNIWRKYCIDINVSMSFNQIFRKRMIEAPKFGTINCHAGKLPYYRGRNILNWVLINDEKEFGITVHYVDEGIDTGDIILQKTYPITDEDTYETLLNVAHKECANNLCEAISLIIDGTVKRISQNTIDAVGMYCGMRKMGDEIINWNTSSRNIFNFIRAITKPGPGALSYLNGKPIVIYTSELVKNAKPYINIPGQIIGASKDGFYVKTADTFIKVISYDYEGKIKIGDRMKSE